MKDSTKQLVVSAVAGLIAVSSSAFANPKKDAKAAAPAAGAKTEVNCVGGNACKGHGACAPTGGTCKAGQNACKGQGWVKAPSKEECDKLVKANKA